MEFASKSIELFQNQTKVFAKSLGYSRKNCNNGFQSEEQVLSLKHPQEKVKIKELDTFSKLSD